MLSMQKNAAVIVALNFFFAFFIVSDAVDCFLSPVLRKLLQAVFNGGEAALRGCFVNPDNKIRQFDINNQPQSGRAQHDNQVKYVAENEKCVAYVVIVKDADEVSKYACKIKTADNDNFRRIFHAFYSLDRQVAGGGIRRQYRCYQCRRRLSSGNRLGVYAYVHNRAVAGGIQGDRYAKDVCAIHYAVNYFQNSAILSL